MKYENISLMIAQEIVSKMMGKTMDDFGNEEVKCLSQKGAVLYEGLEETLKILSLVYNDKGYVCSLYLYVKIELDKEWLYEKITKQIEEMLKKNYDFKIPVFVLEQEKLKDILEHAPIWWGSDDKMIYDNLIFMIPPITFKEVFEEIGEAKEGLEKIQNYKDVIFWSFNRKDYQKTNWWPKTANTNVNKKLTIRTANTIRKIVKM